MLFMIQIMNFWKDANFSTPRKYDSSKDRGHGNFERKLLDHVDKISLRKLQILFIVCEIVVLIVGFLRAFDSKSRITTYMETLKHIM